MDAKPALSPVAELARRHDPDRFLCALFAPPGARETVFTLIAFNNELARAREAARREPMMVLIRLQWWRDAVEEASTGAQARRHEVAEPLAAEIQAGRLDPAALLAMIEAREAEETGEDTPALLARLRGTAGTMAAETGRVLGAPEGAMEGLRQIGTAYGVAGTLRSLTALAAQGRDPLPQGGNAAEAGRELARQGLSLLEAGRRKLAALPKPAVAAALPAVLARRDLKRVLRNDWQPGAPPWQRGVGDRAAVAWAGWRGQV